MKKKTAKKVTPAGAVEISAEDLDQAAGGATFTERTRTTSAGSLPMEQLSLNYSKIEFGY